MQITKKKYRKKRPQDEWFKRDPRSGKMYLWTDGNFRKWVSVKYYGHESNLLI